MIPVGWVDLRKPNPLPITHHPLPITHYPLPITMKLLTDWGFTLEGLRDGKRGEFLVFLQGVFILGFFLIPVYKIPVLTLDKPLGLELKWIMVGFLGLGSAILFIKGLIDLGKSLTPLPYPREDGELVTTGVYQLVRHPVYSGVILGCLGMTIFWESVSHLILTVLLLIFFDIKARKEEVFLMEKYVDYGEYRQRVKKLIPGIY
ncbi:MAG: methyltransferase family protein [Microcoleaceae cyanobacterium]|jgi:protein-S-isoprenylcysteine O-methyltransferase Ste14